ncbi:hypothetical protein VKT23_019384 [Stygiomarasmius scandens]|uniref:Uncharacterized protein n=1 Tax=Marasmiellus scandens TaxID=2682957 RepID=A0ABR1IPV4_9AGAR
MSKTSHSTPASDAPNYTAKLFAVPDKYRHSDHYESDISPTAMVGTTLMPWRPVLLLGLWFPSVLDVKLFSKLTEAEQAMLFDMVTSVLDDYYLWYHHPDYIEPETIRHLLYTLLYNFQSEDSFQKSVHLAPRAFHWFHSDLTEAVDNWVLEKQDNLSLSIRHVQLITVPPLPMPLSISTQPDDDFPEGWWVPDIWPSFYLDAPLESTIPFKVPKSDKYASLVRIPPHLHWNQFVKDDEDSSDDGVPLIKLEKPVSHASVSVSHTALALVPLAPPLLSSPQTNVQDKGKQKADPANRSFTFAGVVMSPLKVPATEAAPASKVRKTQVRQSVTEARGDTSPVPEKPVFPPF